MNIHFFKYQGTGNDFIILDNRTGKYDFLQVKQIKTLCDRHFGIGADGWVLAVLVAIPAVGLAALYWFRNAGIYGRRSASSA